MNEEGTGDEYWQQTEGRQEIAVRGKPVKKQASAVYYKNQASSGFRYQKVPSTKELPYKARCKNPIIEHAVRNFLDWAEVSTLYFDPQKNRREETVLRSSQMVNYGLRLQVTGLAGFYVLKSQAERHSADNALPVPNSYDASSHGRLERSGYRAKPGTSIVIRLNPGKVYKFIVTVQPCHS